MRHSQQSKLKDFQPRESWKGLGLDFGVKIFVYISPEDVSESLFEMGQSEKGRPSKANYTVGRCLVHGGMVKR